MAFLTAFPTSYQKIIQKVPKTINLDTFAGPLKVSFRDTPIPHNLGHCQPYIYLLLNNLRIIPSIICLLPPELHNMLISNASFFRSSNSPYKPLPVSSIPLQPAVVRFDWAAWDFDNVPVIDGWVFDPKPIQVPEGTTEPSLPALSGPIPPI